MVYPTHGNHSDVIYCQRDSGRDECDGPVWAEDLNLSEVFPRGAKGIRICTLPGTTYELRNEYMMFVSADAVSALANYSIAKLFNRFWLGNVVVVKMARRDGLSIVNMRIGERLKVDDIVGSCVNSSSCCIPTALIVRK